MVWLNAENILLLLKWVNFYTRSSLVSLPLPDYRIILCDLVKKQRLRTLQVFTSDGFVSVYQHTHSTLLLVGICSPKVRPNFSLATITSLIEFFPLRVTTCSDNDCILRRAD